MSNVSIIAQAHEAIGDGEFGACRSSYTSGEKGCRDCCTYGSALVPGEQDYLLSIKSRSAWEKEGVYLTAERVDGCLGRGPGGQKTCKMGNEKTLFCKIYPDATWDGDEIALDDKDLNCPATQKSKDRTRAGRVRKVKKLIKPLIAEVDPGLTCPKADRMLANMSRERYR